LIDAKKLSRLGEIRIPLIDIATGPLHFDYNVASFSGFAGRLMFDVRMSQQIKFVLKAKHLICVMKESLNSLDYFYNFKLLVCSLGPPHIDREQNLEALPQ
jgi:hypothetical protein